MLFMGKSRQTMVTQFWMATNASLYNFSGLWYIGAVPCCLVPGPRVVRADGGWHRAGEPSKEGGCGCVFWIGWSAFEKLTGKLFLIFELLGIG